MAQAAGLHRRRGHAGRPPVARHARPRGLHGRFRRGLRGPRPLGAGHARGPPPRACAAARPSRRDPRDRCGPGAATLQLAAETGARITATDTDTGALARLEAAAAASGHAGRITTAAQDMAALPAPDTPFDTIRAEGSAHIIGVARALALWRPLLRPGGTLVLSDMVWRSATPDPELRAFRAREYPDMADVPTRLSQARAAGYRVRGRIDPGPEALDACYTPLAARVAAMARAAVGHAGSGRPHRRTGLLAQCPWPGRLRTLRSPTPLSLPRKALLPWTTAVTSPATSPPSPPCSPRPSPPPKARRRAR
ncbi:SAM-dependent methyltransferase [Roseicyclus sp.]